MRIITPTVGAATVGYLPAILTDWRRVELDARSAPDGTTLSADVCIVGAGPCGLALALELQQSGIAVVVVESGNYDPSGEAQTLNAGEVGGDAYGALDVSRRRAVGGTALSWNTPMHREAAAKYLPLDEVDFEARTWMPWSGWPIDRATLEPYYHRAHIHCGLSLFDYRAATWVTAEQQPFPFGDGVLTNAVYQLGPARCFSAVIPGLLRASQRATLVHGATVVELARSASGDRISEARWATFAGTRGAVRAALFVLASGAIENARLLLALRATRPATNATDWLGRGFMEHPVDTSLQLTSEAPAFDSREGFYSQRVTGPLRSVTGRIALSPSALREHEVPNASVRLVADEKFRLLPMRGKRYNILIDLEQAPHRENRVTLSDKVDRFGQPGVRLQWRWRPEDEGRRERIRALIVDAFNRAGVGRISVVPGQPLDPNAHHHSGTTRMHADPEQGVVTGDLRVHDEENLFVTGSSVFPTAGCANPTLTAVALSLRLADHLVATVASLRDRVE